jgi:hypothetical protein
VGGSSGDVGGLLGLPRGGAEITVAIPSRITADYTVESPQSMDSENPVGLETSLSDDDCT